MLRLDLQDADIETVDADGRVIDFHGKRTTFITGLARAGIAPAMAQKLARHSDVNLTLNTYTHLSLAEMCKAIDRLPDLNQRSDSPQPQAANQPIETDPRMEQIAFAWPQLTEPIRLAIMALVASSLSSSNS